MDEAKQRVTGVLDEFQKKRDDFTLDAAIKVGGGALVGLSFGILTKRFMKIRKPVVAGSLIGFGMSVERYSQQLSAPYVDPPTCEIAVSPTRVFAETWHGSLPTGLMDSISSLTSSFSSSPADPPKPEEPPKAEPVESPPAPEDAAASEAPAEEPAAEPVTEEMPVLEESPAESESIVDVVARELKEEINKAATDIEIVASDVENVAESVEQAAEVVETVAEKVDSIPIAETIEEVALEVETAAADVEAAAEVTEHIAAEVKEATE